jgi:hypothetical protein
MVIKTWSRQGKTPPFTEELVCRVYDACKAMASVRILAAEDASGQIHAAAFLVSDAQTTYYLIGGGDPALRSSGAGNLVIWEAIKHAGNTGTVFDFEGSMNRNIGKFFKSFGAAEEATITVRKCSRRLSLLTALKDVLGASTGRTLPWFF